MNTPSSPKLVSLQASRPSLFDLWTIYQFNAGTLNMQARASAGTVQAMLGNQPVERSEAQKVLEKLSVLLYKECTLDTVYVVLKPETMS